MISQCFATKKVVSSVTSGTYVCQSYVVSTPHDITPGNE